MSPRTAGRMNGAFKLLVAGCLGCLGLGVAARLAPGRVPEAPSSKTSSQQPRVTFNKDIAPIIYKNCADCHHPQGPAPFSLLTYPDVRKRAEVIALVTRQRYMPPWLPEAGYGEFIGERRLSNEQIRLVQRWVEQGMHEGNPADVPPAPEFHAGWQLGQPDLILTMPRPYALRAGGPDVFRNFVFEVPVTTTRYVRALEILPANPRIVHHANLLVDRSHRARLLDAEDPDVGFGGMDLEIESERFEPASHFLFWKPGTPPSSDPADMAWRLDKDTDLVLNMHLQPTGKPEPVMASLGLYFTDQPPTRFPMLIQLEHDGDLDIPPGAKNFLVTDEFKLPVDVQVLGVYPHAHYLGKDIQGYALLPDGRKQWLICIKDWDQNWQAVYRYVNPLRLPKGSTLHMRWTYDNSRDNVRNPNHPPKRVVGGNLSTDEMSHLWIQVLPERREDLKLIEVALMQRRLEKYPHDFYANADLGGVLQSMGQLEEAVAHLREALRIKPGDPTVSNTLGAAYLAQGKPEEAARLFREALESRPDYLDAHYNLGNALLALGKPEEATAHFREVLRLNPDDANAHSDLGSALLMQGKAAEAAAQFERALDISPQNEFAHYNLGYLQAREGNLREAASHLESAVRLKPDDPDAHLELGAVYARQGNLREAIAEFESVLRLDPRNDQARANLERAKSRLGKD